MDNPFNEINEKLEVIESKLDSLSTVQSTEQPKGKPELIAFPEACEYVGLTHNYMRQLCSKKLIPHFKPGGRGRVLFDPVDLDGWLRGNKIEAR